MDVKAGKDMASEGDIRGSEEDDEATGVVGIERASSWEAGAETERSAIHSWQVVHPPRALHFLSLLVLLKLASNPYDDQFF